MHFRKRRRTSAPRQPVSARHRLRSVAFGLGAAVAAAAAIATAAPRGNGIDLQVTLGTDLSEGACGVDTQLDVTRLDLVNFCYVVTNRSPTTLNWHTLADDVSGVLLSAAPISLPPGASHQYNRIVTARDSQAPDTHWTAYDVHPGYAFATNLLPGERIFADAFDGTAGNGEPAYDFVDITGIGTPLGLEDDDSTADIAVGFPFSYYGLTADHLRVAYNGGILFDLEAGWFTPQNVALPAPDVGAAILPYWTDIYYQQPGDGDIYVATLGDAPNRRFVVEWFNLPVMIGGIQQDSATFEAVLYEGSNAILFQYADTNVGDPQRDDGITATIGLNAPAGVDAALQYSYKTASVSAGKAILFSPTAPTAYTASALVTLDVGVPKIAVTPTQFDVAAVAGGSTTATLDIGNVGNRALTWNIGSFGSESHFPATSRYTVPLGDPAATNAAPAPRRKAHPRSTPAQAPQAAGVASFAIDFDTSSLVGFDATLPDAISPVAGVGDLILTAGEFVDEDFTQLYAIDYYSWHLLTMNTRDGSTSVVGTAVLQSGAGINWSGLAWDASTGTLYGAAYAPGRFGYDAFLYTIDPLTAESTLVGRIGGIGDPADGTLVVDIAIDANGNLFGVDIVADDFVAIDKTNANAAVIASLGFDANFAQGLDFDDYTGLLYYAAFNNSVGEAQMYTIEPSTGALTLVGAIGTDPSQTQLAAFAIARLGGVCAYPNDVPWLGYSTTRGSTGAGETTPVTVSFDASTLGPGTYHANVCIANNDLTNRRVPVPVTFTVN